MGFLHTLLFLNRLDPAGLGTTCDDIHSFAKYLPGHAVFHSSDKRSHCTVLPQLNREEGRRLLDPLINRKKLGLILLYSGSPFCIGFLFQVLLERRVIFHRKFYARSPTANRWTFGPVVSVLIFPFLNSTRHLNCPMDNPIF